HPLASPLFPYTTLFRSPRSIKVIDTMNSPYSTHRWNQYGWFCAYPHMRGIFSLLVAALSLALSLAGASPELPSTPAGKDLAGGRDRKSTRLNSSHGSIS